LLYDFHLTDDPTIAAAVYPGRGYIEINVRFDDEDIISMLLRHELMHLILRHEQNGIKWLAPTYGINPAHMKKRDYLFLKKKLYTNAIVPSLSTNNDGSPKYGAYPIMNFAGDWDLSRFYNSMDKEKQKLLGGMILELDHPEMKDMTYFELLDTIAEWERKYRRDAMTVIEGNLEDDASVFIPDDEVEKEDTDEI